MDNRKRNIVIISLTIIVILILQLPFTSNFWMLITQKNFDIPKESSFWAFRPDLVNNVRDDWWFYGHDSKNYYFKDENGFRIISKADSENCPGFSAQKVNSWCSSKSK